MTRQKRKILIGDVIGDILAVLIFIVPFYFMFVTSLKSKKEANLLRITFPAHIHWENFRKVIQACPSDVIPVMRKLPCDRSQRRTF